MTRGRCGSLFPPSCDFPFTTPRRFCRRTRSRAMLIIGCDFHARFQQIAMLDPTTGEMIDRRLEHENGEAQKFYATLPSAPRVGMEATINAQWFERLLQEHHHELWIGDAAEIRAAMVRKQKTDRRD